MPYLTKASLILIPLLVFICGCLFSQQPNPFRSIGKKTAIIDISKGKYVEIIEKEPLERIGSVIIDRHNRKIVKFLDGDFKNEPVNNSQQSKFLSVDPLASSFPEYSPYLYAGNTPIQAIDLDGLEEYVITRELYRSGRIKNISIQYTISKEDNKELVNAHFREALGRNPDGTDKVGDYLTDQKIVRITYDANNKVSSKPGNELTQQERAIIDHRSKNEKNNKDDNYWTLTIGKKLYYSETDRNTAKMTDKIAEGSFREIIPVFNGTPLQPGSTLDFKGSNNYVLGGRALSNGGQLGNDLPGELNQLADQLQKADNVTSVTLNINQGINAPAGSQEYNTAQQHGTIALNNAVNLLRAKLKGTNIGVNVGSVNTSPNETVADLKQRGARVGLNATIQ